MMTLDYLQSAAESDLLHPDSRFTPRPCEECDRLVDDGAYRLCVRCADAAEERVSVVSHPGHAGDAVAWVHVWGIVMLVVGIGLGYGAAVVLGGGL